MSYEILFNEFHKDYETIHDWDSDSSLWVPDGNIWELKEESQDAYDLMISFASYGYIKKAMLVTYGWAAPMNDSHAPSKHPEKKRVRVCVYLEGENFLTCMQIKDEMELIIQDDPVGNIIDVVQGYVNKAKTFINQKNNLNENPF